MVKEAQPFVDQEVLLTVVTSPSLKLKYNKYWLDYYDFFGIIRI